MKNGSKGGEVETYARQSTEKTLDKRGKFVNIFEILLISVCTPLLPSNVFR